jgi:prepilin-type N-terminal cleavage/methylation domain-containing protein
LCRQHIVFVALGLDLIRRTGLIRIMTIRSTTSRRAFTLIEILVVIGIIAILMSILIPVMGRAKQAASRTACLAQLKDIGNFFQMYLNENKQRVPRVNPLPSDPTLVPGAPSIVDVLQPYHKGATKVFNCPADRIINDVTDTDQPTASQQTNPRYDAETYFEREGTSYSYNHMWNAFLTEDANGRQNTWANAIKQAQERRPDRTADKLAVMVDFDPFHDKAGKPTSRNALFADFHAGPREIGR